MADLDLQIVVGVGAGRGGYPDPEIRGGPSQKDFFRTFGPKFDLKIRRAGTRPPPPGPSPGSTPVKCFTGCPPFFQFFCYMNKYKQLSLQFETCFPVITRHGGMGKERSRFSIFFFF